jgi:hypothetical protein
MRHLHRANAWRRLVAGAPRCKIGVPRCGPERATSLPPPAASSSHARKRREHPAVSVRSHGLWLISIPHPPPNRPNNIPTVPCSQTRRTHLACCPQRGGQILKRQPCLRPAFRFKMSPLLRACPPPPLDRRTPAYRPHEECLWRSFTDPPLGLSPPRGRARCSLLRRAARARGSACKRRKGKSPLTPHCSARDISRRIPTAIAISAIPKGTNTAS